MPSSQAVGTVTIKGTGWGGATIKVLATKALDKNIHGFIEADGYIALEAASAKPMQQNIDAKWVEISRHGHTHSSMTGLIQPEHNFLKHIKTAPYLEYDLHLFSSGVITITAYLAPSLNFAPGRGLRFAISLDGEEPQLIDVLAENTNAKWEESVKNGVHKVSSKHVLSTPGAKKLRLYLVE